LAHILDVLSDQVLLCDGATGTRIQALPLRLDEDFQGRENCPEILNETRPDLVLGIHRGYLEAGADAIQTNSFGGSPLTLGEFGIGNKARALNCRAAELACEAVAGFAADGKTRFVIGAVGPGTRLPSRGHIDYDALEAALTVQCRGLIEGGVDAILIETCQDTLQIKAAINAAKAARQSACGEQPIFVLMTVETTGTLLVGADVAATMTVLDALDVPLIGFNCATGPQEMAEHVKLVAENWSGRISVRSQPGTISPRLGASGSGVMGRRTLVTRAKRPAAVRPIQVPPALRSRPPRISGPPSVGVHQARRLAGRAKNSSRLAATTNGKRRLSSSASATRHMA